jgi:excisionase family DNA binding protein
MNTENRITLKEMAQRLNRCPKTFRKYVIEYQIPHICLGRDMLFNAAEVENYLSTLTLANQPAAKTVQVSATRKSKTKQNSNKVNKSRNHYASLLGLS